MDDMISRQAAIKAFKDFLTIHDSRGAEYLCSAVTMDGVNRILSDLPSVQPEHLVKESGNLVNGLVNDCISRQAAIDALGDKPLAWTEGEYELGLQNQWQSDVDALKELPSAQPEQIARDIATIIENEKDMRVMLKNAEHTETHSCENQPTETHDSRREWYMKGYRDAQNAAMHESCTDCPLYDHDRHNCPRFNKVIPRTIEAAKPRWIAVEEALPEDDKRVLCQMKGGELVFGFHHGKYWAYGHKPIAWFPLPEPYKEGQNG